jgi:hypothetical protein
VTTGQACVALALNARLTRDLNIEARVPTPRCKHREKTSRTASGSSVINDSGITDDRELITTRAVDRLAAEDVLAAATAVRTGDVRMFREPPPIVAAPLVALP